MEVIFPAHLLFDPQKLSRAIENGLEGAAKAAQVDFEVTTQTWKHKPAFTIERETGARTIGTNDAIYGYVDQGTPPHVIVARSAKVLRFGVPSSPKTTPHVIGSGAGSRGSTIVQVPRVHHPGTAARDFADEIAKKWTDELPVILQRAVDAEV